MDKTPEQLELNMEGNPTFGPAYVKALDGERVAKQMDTIRDLMLDGQKRTLKEIAAITGYPEASISAQLRHLRKPDFGSYVVLKDRVHKGGLHHYWIDGQYFTQLPKK